MRESDNCPSATLPIEISDGLSMDAGEARALGSLFHDEYASAVPYPHIVLDEIFPTPLIDMLLRNFPRETAREERVFNIGYGGENKRQVTPEHCGRFSREFFWFLNSRPVLQFLEGLTGIEALLPDPYFEGAGYHEISRGGLLGIHADFRINPRLHAQRRINLLIYLNPAWDDAWGGHLELWSRDMSECARRVAPVLNRCVVFSTESDSWHGHPDPLQTPDGVMRRSIAMYYYTASKHIYDETPDHSTMYMARPSDTPAVRAEARSFRVEQYLRDWLPPVAYRGLARVRRVIERLGQMPR